MPFNPSFKVHPSFMTGFMTTIANRHAQGPLWCGASVWVQVCFSSMMWMLPAVIHLCILTVLQQVVPSWSTKMFRWKSEIAIIRTYTWGRNGSSHYWMFMLHFFNLPDVTHMITWSEWKLLLALLVGSSLEWSVSKYANFQSLKLKKKEHELFA